MRQPGRSRAANVLVSVAVLNTFPDQAVIDTRDLYPASFAFRGFRLVDHPGRVIRLGGRVLQGIRGRVNRNVLHDASAGGRKTRESRTNHQRNREEGRFLNSDHLSLQKPSPALE